MKATLTDITIRAMKPGVYFDAKLPAFGIRIGLIKKTWLVVRGKTRTQTVVGHYPDVGLAEARTAAKKLLTEKPVAKAASITFAEARTRYVESHTGRPSTVKEAKRLLTKHFGKLDAKELPTITDSQVSACLKPLKPSEALHAFRAIRAMLRWCVKPPRRYITHSPMEGYEAPGQDGRKTRILSDAEVKAVLEHSDGVPGAIVRLMLLWGTRKGETLALRRDWITDGVLTIPGDITKNGRPHIIPILPLAQSVLDGLPKRGQYFFPGRHSALTHLADGSWTKLHLAILTASKTEKWSAHDCRRTFRSSCAKLGVSRDLSERLLNHAQGALDEIYDHHTYIEEKRTALAKIENWISGLLPSTVGPPGA